MEDAKLVFDDGSTAITTDAVKTVLDMGEIEEPGRGTPVYVEIWLKEGFTTSTETIAVHLVTSATTDPIKTNVLMTLVPATAASALGTPGLLAKVPLPSHGVKQYTSIAYTLSAALAAGKIKAFLSIP